MSIDLLDLSTKLFTINQNPLCSACFNHENVKALHRPSFYHNHAAAITVEQLKYLISQKRDIYLIDVRTNEEYEQGHLPNAINIPLSALPHAIKVLEKEKIVILYCETALRSIAAYKQLKEKKFQALFYLKSGYSQAKASIAAFANDENAFV